MDSERINNLFFYFIFICVGIIGLLFYFLYPFELSSFNRIYYYAAIIFSIVCLIIGLSYAIIDFIFKISPFHPNLGLAILFLTTGSGFLIFFIIAPNIVIPLFLLGILNVAHGGLHVIVHIQQKRTEKPL